MKKEVYEHYYFLKQIVPVNNKIPHNNCDRILREKGGENKNEEINESLFISIPFRDVVLFN